MIESISSTSQIYTPQYAPLAKPAGGLLNFDIEDEAIISAQAKILSELDKFNAGAGNELELVMANVMGKIQTEAAVNVIKTKDEMMDTVMSIMD